MSDREKQTVEKQTVEKQTGEVEVFVGERDFLAGDMMGEEVEGLPLEVSESHVSVT
jgi:hypothetical protein